MNHISPEFPSDPHFKAVVVALRETVKSATVTLLLFHSPSQNSMAVITVSPTQPTPQDGFGERVFVCVLPWSALAYQLVILNYLGVDVETELCTFIDWRAKRSHS